jgi:hypothetical protein
MVNSRLPKQMVLLGARPTPIRMLPLAIKQSFGEQTIGTSRGKRHLSLFSAPVNYGVVKIAHSSSKVVL